MVVKNLSEHMLLGRFKCVELKVTENLTVSKSLLFSYWDKGEPNNQYNQEDCAEFKGFPEPMAWNDRECSDYELWVCEKCFCCE